MSKQVARSNDDHRRCAVKLERGEAPERGTIVGLVVLGGLVGVRGRAGERGERKKITTKLIKLI